MESSTPECLQVGTFFQMLPIPPVEENCVEVTGGPLRFVVEARQLSDALVYEAIPEVEGQAADLGAVNLDDFGASVHVCGADDGLEHLRFDCFDRDAHYHYIRNADGGNLVCSFDPAAEGDSMTWTMRCLRERLPEMLAFAGVADLGDRVRAKNADVQLAVDEVAVLLEKAQVAAAQAHAALP
jgi:hypothetical protein